MSNSIEKVVKRLMSREISHSSYKKQIEKKLDGTPYALKGEWKYIIENKPIVDRIIETDDEPNWFSIQHVSSGVEEYRHPYIAKRVSKYIENENSIICEIGAGLGGVCKDILTKCNPKNKYKYIIFDIPEVLFVTSYFLSLKLGKNFKIFYYDGNESKFDFNKTLEEYDLILLPHYMVEYIPKNIVDIFINTGSFCEMPKDVCKHYFNKILESSKDSTKFYFEFRAEDKIKDKRDGDILHPSEIYVEPVLYECNPKLKRLYFTKISDICPDWTKEIHDNFCVTLDYVEAVYEN